MLHLMPNGQHRITILPDRLITIGDNGVEKLVLRKPDFDREMVICPCDNENFSSIELMELRLWCDDNRTKLIAYGRKNYLPHYSVYADEVWFVDRWLKEPRYYGCGTTNNWMNVPFIKPYDWAHIFWHRRMPKERIVERFWQYDICILESAYEKFLSMNLESNLLVYEMKLISAFMPVLNEMKALGHRQLFQAELLEKAGQDNYMSVQILASNLLNWRYVACGGASNLFAVIPIKTVFLCDHQLCEFKIDVLREIYTKRYGEFGSRYPFVFGYNCVTSQAAGKVALHWDEIKIAAASLGKLPPPKLLRGKKMFI